MPLYWGGVILCFAAHLAFCYLGRIDLHRATKGLLLPLLAVGLLLTRTFDPWVWAGLALGLAGDMLLLFPGKICFMAGAAAFITGHFAYMGALLLTSAVQEGIARHPVLLCGPTVILALALGAVCHRLAPKIGGIAYFGALYFTVEACACLCALLGGSYLIAAGFAFFLISDGLLAIHRFGGGIRRDAFWVMLPYLAAEGLIIAGFLYR